MQVEPNFDEAMVRKNQYELHYGQEKSVHAPVWSGAEGDQAALVRASYPSSNAQAYFSGGVYNQQYRNMVTSALQGSGQTIYDRVQLTGMDDYYTGGRNYTEYGQVSMSGGLDTGDYLLAAGIIGIATAFIFFSG